MGSDGQIWEDYGRLRTWIASLESSTWKPIVSAILSVCPWSSVRVRERFTGVFPTDASAVTVAVTGALRASAAAIFSECVMTDFSAAVSPTESPALFAASRSFESLAVFAGAASDVGPAALKETPRVGEAASALVSVPSLVSVPVPTIAVLDPPLVSAPSSAAPPDTA